ncbi:MAG: hypothetical protein K8R68_07065 [Bacteroidales bacterium]|nr:hypothetical protein [Bacteroidales bacterium]
MVKKLLTIVAIAALFASCSGGAGTDKANNENQEVEAVEITTPEISLGEFETKAGDYVDKEVIVAGIVDHICKHGGKRLLLVSDDGDVHVDAEERFDDEIAGSEIILTGIVTEFRVDEAYCLKMEEDNIQSHTEGETDDEGFEMKMEQIEFYRDSMKTADTDHLSFYSLDYVSHIVKEQGHEHEHDHENEHDH